MDQLSGDLGGITGVLIGLSVITVVETVVGIVSFISVCGFRRSLL
jgi:hypothetical protein